MGYMVAVMASKLLWHFSVLLFHFSTFFFSGFLFPSTSFHVIFSLSLMACSFSPTEVPALADLLRMCAWDSCSSFQIKCPFLRWVGHLLHSAVLLRPFSVLTTYMKTQIPDKWAAHCKLNWIPLKTLWISSLLYQWWWYFMLKLHAWNFKKDWENTFSFGCLVQTPVQSLKGFSKVMLPQGCPCKSASPSCLRFILFDCQQCTFFTPLPSTSFLCFIKGKINRPHVWW